MVGCSSRAIEYWESGKRGISFEYADKIFKALGKTITQNNYYFDISLNLSWYKNFLKIK